VENNPRVRQGRQSVDRASPFKMSSKGGGKKKKSEKDEVDVSLAVPTLQVYKLALLSIPQNT